MPIVASDLKYRLSGGSSNANPLLSIGGPKSSTDAASTIFDDVTSAEAATGESEYRCIYVHNNHGALAALDTKIWIHANTPSAYTNISMGAGAAAINAAEGAVADENTAPAGVTFSTPTDLASGISLGTIPAGQHKAVWLRRTVSEGAEVTADGFTIRVGCDTLP